SIENPEDNPALPKDGTRMDFERTIAPNFAAGGGITLRVFGLDITGDYTHGPYPSASANVGFSIRRSNVVEKRNPPSLVNEGRRIRVHSAGETDQPPRRIARLIAWVVTCMFRFASALRSSIAYSSEARTSASCFWVVSSIWASPSRTRRSRSGST